MLSSPCPYLDPSLIPFCANDIVGKVNNTTPNKIEFVFISLNLIVFTLISVSQTNAR